MLGALRSPATSRIQCNLPSTQAHHTCKIEELDTRHLITTQSVTLMGTNHAVSVADGTR